jgi:hypothetical protein
MGRHLNLLPSSSLFFFLYLSLSLSLSLPLSLPFSLSPFLSLSLPFSLSHFLSLPLGAVNMHIVHSSETNHIRNVDESWSWHVCPVKRTLFDPSPWAHESHLAELSNKLLGILKHGMKWKRAIQFMTDLLLRGVRSQTTDMNIGKAHCLALWAPTLYFWFEITKSRKFVLQGIIWITQF